MINIACICKHCKKRNIDSAIQIDFAKQTIYFVCPECRKQNILKVREDPKPLPRIGIGR